MAKNDPETDNLLGVPFANERVRREHEARECARRIGSMLNSGSDAATEQFIDQMSAEHRTLQQLFTRLCLHWFKYNSETPFFDGRNEYTVKVSKEIRAKLEERLGSAWCHTPLI